MNINLNIPSTFCQNIISHTKQQDDLTVNSESDFVGVIILTLEMEPVTHLSDQNLLIKIHLC